MFQIALTLLVATAALASAQIVGGQRRDVPYGGGINLRQFGGPNVEILIYGKNMGVVAFAIVDNEHEVVSAETNISSVQLNTFTNTATVRGENHVVFHPVTTRRSIHLGKGVDVDATERQAYLLYEVPDGPKVYLFDVLDTRQNECALLVLPKPAGGSSSESVGARLRKVEKLQKDGVISEAEARKKRQEILANL